MREVAAALTGPYDLYQCLSLELCHANLRSLMTYLILIHTGLKLTKAYTYLHDVQEHKQVIPFTRFNGGVGRASQAKQFGRTQGARGISQDTLPAYCAKPTRLHHR